MYKLDIQVDLKEAAAIERRRNMEKQRQSRIFNARERTIGVDLQALDQQIKERKQTEEEEKLRHESYASMMIHNDKVVQLLQQRQDKDRALFEQAELEYRKEHQRPEDRKEYDLNDPDLKKKDLPARVSDDDPRLTQSGMQMFEGEDLMYEQRKKFQQEQMREWVKQQAAEKERITMEQRKAEQLYQLKACEMDQRAVDLAAAEEETRRAINHAVKDYNLALSKEKAAKVQHDTTQEQDDNFTEIINNIHGDMLTENPEVSQSAFGPQRVIPDRWKGMSPAQLAEIRRTQEEQRAEKERIESERVLLDREHDRRRVAEAKAGLLLENQANRHRQKLRHELVDANKQIASDQKARQEVLDKQVYINPPTDDYFAQFNTSSR